VARYAYVALVEAHSFGLVSGKWTITGDAVDVFSEDQTERLMLQEWAKEKGVYPADLHVVAFSAFEVSEECLEP
jgi:hypothetical protein